MLKEVGVCRTTVEGEFDSLSFKQDIMNNRNLNLCTGVVYLCVI